MKYPSAVKWKDTSHYQKVNRDPVIHPFIEDDEFWACWRTSWRCYNEVAIWGRVCDFSKNNLLILLYSVWIFFAVAGERASFMLMKGPVSRGSLRIPVGLCYGFWAIRPPTRSESVKGMLWSGAWGANQGQSAQEVSPSEWTQMSETLGESLLVESILIFTCTGIAKRAPHRAVAWTSDSPIGNTICHNTHWYLWIGIPRSILPFMLCTCLWLQLPCGSVMIKGHENW